MARFAKKILLTICSCMFAFCLALTGMTLANTNKTVNADEASTPTVTFDSIDATQNNTSWNNSNNGWMAVYMTFTGAELTGDNYGLSATLPNGVSCVPVGETPSNYGIWRSGNQLQFLYDTANTVLSDGSMFTIAEGTSLYGQIFPEVKLVVKGGKWVDANAPAVEPTVTFEGVEETQNNVMWASNATWNGTYLTFSGNAFNESKDINPDGIYFTNADGTGKTKFSAVWTSADYGATLNMVQLLSNGQAIPAGSILHIEKNTEIGGQVLPEVTLYMNYEGKWQDTPPSPVPTVTFTGVDANQNNKSWSNAPSWTATYLLFEESVFTAQNATSDSIYYTAPGSDDKIYFKAVWVDASATNRIMLLDDEKTVPEGATLHVEKAAPFQAQYLPEITLYLVNGIWVTEKPVVVGFTGIGAHNNDNWLATGGEAPNPGFVALDLVFNVDFEKAEAANTGIYYTVPGNDTRNYFNYVWANNGTAAANVIQLLMSKDAAVNPKGFYPESAILHIAEGTVVGGHTLPALTLYLNADGEWQTEKCLQKYIGFTTEVGGSIRVSSDKHNGLRFESRIDYAQYNALVASGENINAVELGTYILPKHYLEAYISQGRGDLLSYVTTQTEGTHFKKVSTWDEDKSQNGFINRGTAETDGYYAYYGAITNIQLHNYTTEFIGVGYLKIGDDLYLTHDGSWSRNVYYIAEQAYVHKEGDTFVNGDSKKPALLEYLGNVVSIHDEDGALVDNWDVLNGVRPVGGVQKGYTLELNAETGLIAITAGEKGISSVVIEGQRLGSIAANTTKYADYYSVNRELVDTAEEAGAIHFGIIEPTQELWGEGGSDLWNVDAPTFTEKADENGKKDSSDWATAFLHDKSNAANVAKVTSAMGGDTARIWMNTLDFVWGSNAAYNSLDELKAGGLNDGAIAVLQKVINDTYDNGATNISILSGIAELCTTRNHYNATTKKWYNRWGFDEENQNNGGVGANDGYVAGLIVLPNESDYEQFLLLQREYFKQLALACGDKVTAIEVMNEIDNSTASFRCYVEGNVPQNFAALKAQAVMDVCRMATLGVQDAGKNIKIAMPALTCVGGSADFFTAQYTSIKGTRINDNLSPETQALFATKDADDYFQIVNIHPYVFLSNETSSTNYLYSGSGSSRKAESYENIKERWTKYVESLRKIAVENGDGEKPFWITELGIADYKACGNSSDLNVSNWSDYWNNTVARQARVFQAVFDAIETLPYIDTVMAFRVGDYAHTDVDHDYAQCGEASYGMIDKNGNLKAIGKYLYAIVNGQNIWSGTVGNSTLIETSSIEGIDTVTEKVEGIY